MPKHNYINPAFCQRSEFYPITSGNVNDRIESIYNHSVQSNYNTQTNNSLVKRKLALSSTAKSTSYHKSCEAFHKYSKSDQYTLVPVEDIVLNGSKQYAVVSSPSNSKTHQIQSNRYNAKSQDNLYKSKYAKSSLTDDDIIEQKDSIEFCKSNEPSTSLPSTFGETFVPTAKKRRISLQNRHDAQNLNEAKIKNAFSSDFNNKSFLLVDTNSNQRYQVIPTSENEELVDDNHEIIQMSNGQTHRYAIIPTEDLGNDYLKKGDSLNADIEIENETCLSNSDLNRTEPFNVMTNNSKCKSSAPEKTTSSLINLFAYPTTPMKNPIATKMLHELLSTPPRNNITRASLRSHSYTPRIYMNSPNAKHNLTRHQSLRNSSPPPPLLPRKKSQLSTQRLYYETVIPDNKKIIMDNTLRHENDRTMAIIQPRVATMRSELPLQLAEDETSNSNGKKQKDINNVYPRKIAQATLTLAIVSLMLVLSSAMNLGLTIYIIAHLGKSFYLQFSLVAAFCGIGLGFLGFRSRHSEWLPNRSYISGYVLVTIFSLLKCCCLLVILVLDPYPGLPLHDVTTGIILGLSTFSIFFIGLGVIGSLWCYHPPPDNRIHAV